MLKQSSSPRLAQNSALRQPAGDVQGLSTHRRLCSSTNNIHELKALRRRDELPLVWIVGAAGYPNVMKTNTSAYCIKRSRNSLVVARLPAAREVPGSNPRCGHIVSVFFTKNHCDTQLWVRAAHLLQCLGRLSLPPSEGR